MARDVLGRGDRSIGAALSAGALAGIIGGILMAAFAMMYAGMTGMGFLAPLYMIGATFYGPEALVGGAGVLMYGLMLHMITSAVWGAMFALIVGPDTSPGAALGWGILFSVAVLVVMTYGVLPWANPTMSARVPMMMGPFVVEHLLYGLGLGLTPTLERRASRAAMLRA